MAKKLEVKPKIKEVIEELKKNDAIEDNKYLQFIMEKAVSLSDTETKKSEKTRIILETLQKDFEIVRK